MQSDTLIPHLFRTEYSKLVSVLTRSFGIEHIEIAEDIASETFLIALNTWPYKGQPANPTAWLYTVAKNRIKNHFVRNRIFKTKISQKVRDEKIPDEIDIDFSANAIADSQLQMLFTVCHPSISTEAQICLALRILCGLGLAEIADALLSNKETVHKRLQRAREKLRSEQITLEILDSKVIKERLETVLQTIYLVFSEGYYSERNNSIVRKDLCIEALNLTYLLLGNELTNTHATNALLSLLCFQSSRLEARTSEDGNLILYDDQDRKLWDKEFIEKGFYYLQQASKWEITSPYYLEASIAYWHTVDNTNTAKWPSILKLYDALSSIHPSPIGALNRIWALSKVHGNAAAIQAAESLHLQTNHFYFVLLAELYTQIDSSLSVSYLKKALTLCKTDTEKKMIQEEIRKRTVSV
ncbi:sigma-70 family RNA polymerase sigma factor [Cytophagaceae bacterium DM2B3-1]|uniref:Sigma-70 family RNA polymerase sigma factor n=1 Tax=Xanthocytophaga flava TaxID=3048013 RepID=A0ABT7CY45_9BACT|nr:sigma-70 family RNA polymerase sigma factor [Xanthocytophaga flavus]MDJ1498581.1 sigma-70 family RNA polymerase sigma factor [Xanthocytophaga flavus]